MTFLEPRLAAASRGTIAVLLCGLAALCSFSSSSGDLVSPPRDEAKKRVASIYASQPLTFEQNRGQTDQQVKFLSRGRGCTVFLTGQETVLKFGSRCDRSRDAAHPIAAQKPASVLRMRLVGANHRPRMAGAKPQPSHINYFKGKDPKKWQAEVPVYEQVRCESVYRGVDLVYYGNPKDLEYDFVVAPGADPSQIRLDYSGQHRMELDSHGDLLLQVGDHTVRQHRPVVYQEVGRDRRSVDGAYRLDGGKSGEVTLALGEYDPKLPLVIDPVLGYSTYLGGSDEDYGGGVAIDNSNFIYVAGKTASVDFPLNGPYQNDGGGEDVFLTKFGQNPAGVGVVYSTYLGGSNDDFFHSEALAGRGLVVDNNGIAYITGYTYSGDFPTMGAYQGSLNGTVDAFVTKLDTNIHGAGSLLYSTYLGGSAIDRGYALAVDGAAKVCVVGVTGSVDFPAVGALQTDKPLSDGFVARLDTNLTGPASLLYSTYLGGNDADIAYSVVVDNADKAYVIGTTRSTDFPVLGAFQAQNAGIDDVFVTQLDTTATGAAALLYSTYLGGSDFEEGYGIAVDAAGLLYITGATYSTDFPTLGAYQLNQPDTDAIVAKIDPHLTGAASLLYSTYLGGNNIDVGWSIALGGSGRVYITGGTRSSDYPVLGAFQQHAGPPGEIDAMVTKLDTTATGAASLLYSTFLGGSAADIGEGIAVNAFGEAVVAGWTRASDFPVSPNRFQTDQLFADVFVSRVVYGPNSFMLGGGSYSVPEAGTPMLQADSHGVLITLNRAGDTSGPVSVDYGTEDISAMAGMDYMATSGRLSLEGGDTSKSVLVPITPDAALEGNETFKISLSNPSGTTLSDPSTATVTIEDDLGAPAPVRLNARVTSMNSVELSWTDMCANETDFGLEKSTDGGTKWLQPDSVPAMEGTGGVVVKSLAGLARGASVSFRVRARAAMANSDYSNVVEVTRPLPSAPTRFRAKATSASSIHLKWQDGSSGEATFRIERQTGNGEFDQAFNAKAGATEYDDTKLAANMTYTYRIRSEVGAVFSDWADTASAMTPRKVGGVLEVTPPALDFGQVKVLKSKQLSLVIRNASKTEDLQITVQKPAAPFALAKVGTGQLIIAPNATRKVQVRFRPVKRQAYSGSLSITSSDRKKPVSVPLNGTGR